MMKFADYCNKIGKSHLFIYAKVEDEIIPHLPSEQQEDARAAVLGIVHRYVGAQADKALEILQQGAENGSFWDIATKLKENQDLDSIDGCLGQGEKND